MLGVPPVDVMGTLEEAAVVSAATNFSFSLWAVAVWATGSVLLLTFFIRNHWTFCRKLLRESLTDHRLQSLAENLAQTLGLKRTPRVLLSPSEFGPSAFGVFRHMLVLPKSTSQKGNVSELEPVIAPELVHLRRCDPLAAWLQLAAVCLNWWNPLVWWSSRAVTRSRENCCDREVLGSFKYPPERYAQALIDVLRNPLPRPAPLVIAALPLTKDRIENIMLRHNSLLAKSPRWCWVVILLLAAVVLPAGSPPADNQATNPLPSISETAPTTEKDAMETPKLIYLAWSQPKPKDKNAEPRQLWTPKGRILSEADVSETIGKRLHLSTHEQEGYPQLECLTLFFDVDDRLTHSPIFPTVLSAGNSGTRWTAFNPEKDEKGLAFTSLSLLKRDLEKWPARISMEIKYPLENLTVIKTIKEVPKEPVKIAEGITWYLDESRANVENKSVAVFQSSHDRPDQLTSYSVRVYLKDEEKPLRGAYTTIIEPDGQRNTIDVSDPVDPEEIERIEVIRQRRETRLIKDIPIKVELMPSPE
jgi:beta-lactamase regulating signal transducer with metallopeptidase domain